MFQKKIGRMTFSAWLNYELRQSNLAAIVFCGALTAVAYLTVRALSGSPYQMILALGIGDLVPPVWLMTIIRFLSFLLIGCAAGLILGLHDATCSGEKYRGGMLCLLLIIAELLWYPLLFRSGLVFLATILSILILALAACTASCFLRLSKLAGAVLILHIAYLSYLLILTCAILFRN